MQFSVFVSPLSFKDSTTYRGNKVSRALLPVEYSLARFVEGVWVKSGWPQSWTTGTAACQWQGVGCTDQVVRRIHWTGRNLSGTFIWKEMPQTLLVFAIYENRIADTLSVSVLPRKLLHFDIGGNCFYGTIDFIALPPALAHFSVSHNEFTGLIDLRELSSNLRILYLNYNDFETVHFGLLHKTMEELHLEYNKRLTGELPLENIPQSLAPYFYRDETKLIVM